MATPESRLQEMHYQSVLMRLDSPNPSTIDTEDLIFLLQSLKKPTLNQANHILDVATGKASSWVTDMDDTEAVLNALTPSLATKKAHVESLATDEADREFVAQTSQIAAGIILADRHAYPLHLREMVKTGELGKKEVVLAGTLQELCLRYEGRRELPLGDEEDRVVDTLATVIDDLIEVDPESAKKVGSLFPPHLFFASEDMSNDHPNTYRIVSEAVLSRNANPELLETYLNITSHHEGRVLMEKIARGEFGDPVDVFSGLCAQALGSEEPDIAEDFWIELMELNRYEPRLRPLREKLLSEEWYWDPDSKMLTLVETANSFRLHKREQIEDFVAKNEDYIVEALFRDATRGRDERYHPGIELARSKGEFVGRLAAIVDEVQNIARYNPDFLIHFNDSLLLAGLHSPVPQQS